MKQKKRKKKKIVYPTDLNETQKKEKNNVFQSGTYTFKLKKLYQTIDTALNRALKCSKYYLLEQVYLTYFALQSNQHAELNISSTFFESAHGYSHLSI